MGPTPLFMAKRIPPSDLGQNGRDHLQARVLEWVRDAHPKILLTLQKARHCSQRKRPTIYFLTTTCNLGNIFDEHIKNVPQIYIRRLHIKHRIAFLRLKFTVSFFSISWKAFENTPKALKIKPFVLFRAKSWFRINGREEYHGWPCRHLVGQVTIFLPVCISTPHFEALKPKQDLILRSWGQNSNIAPL